MSDATSTDSGTTVPKYKHNCPQKCKELYGDAAFSAYKAYTRQQVADKGFCTRLQRAGGNDTPLLFCCSSPIAGADSRNLCDAHYAEFCYVQSQQTANAASYEERRAAREQRDAKREADALRRQAEFQDRERRRKERAAQQEAARLEREAAKEKAQQQRLPPPLPPSDDAAALSTEWPQPSRSVPATRAKQRQQ